jgi:glycosyltransferase involved in cell wall biosynthesis
MVLERKLFNMTDSSCAGRLLFISRQFPYDIEKATYGIFQRMRMLLDAAVQTFEVVDVLFFVDEDIINIRDPQTQANLIELHWGIKINLSLFPLHTRQTTWWNTYITPIWSIRNHTNFFPSSSREHTNAIREIIRPTTILIVAHRLHVALAVRELHGIRPPVLMDLDDVEHLKFLRELWRPPFWAGKFMTMLHLPALVVGEILAVRSTAKTLVCSISDRDYVKRVSLFTRVDVVPNAVDLAGISLSDTSEVTSESNILFVGTYSYQPNVEAAESLVRDIFPLIREVHPNAQLLLVGNRIDQLPCYKESPVGVVFLGFVKDLSVVYGRAAVVCCPIRSGSGTRIKIIEAAAHGKPVVSTSIGAEGLAFENGSEIVINNSNSGMASACVDLLKNRTKGHDIGSNAKKRAKTYDRTGSVTLIVEKYRDVISHELNVIEV